VLGPAADRPAGYGTVVGVAVAVGCAETAVPFGDGFGGLDVSDTLGTMSGEGIPVFVSARVVAELSGPLGEATVPLVMVEIVAFMMVMEAVFPLGLLYWW
jgi:hypothetical protein